MHICLLLCENLSVVVNIILGRNLLDPQILGRLEVIPKDGYDLLDLVI